MAAAAGRACGSFSRHRETTSAKDRGIPGRATSSGSGASRSIAITISNAFVPVKGRFAVSISYKTTPSAKQSLLSVSSLSLACSGDM